ncbi:MAG: hypothetical protein JWQ89_503 [Devosia sp.]|uniref:hypothetical protein n=1 Tax=Devosia sp. TaxID=1871048 RepID=UPI0026250B07|nr:hypothetical protein [Devosia sp.]MDB5538776.1 hypothetical protein [Devosia sp.]
MTVAWRNGSFPVLSELGQKVIAVECALCDRRGRYRADRLFAKFGDVVEAAFFDLIAKDGGCERALNPPAINDINYNADKCQIQRGPGGRRVVPPMLATAMHNGWRLFVICERRHQGLKSVKPCKGANEMDLRTLIAAIGPDVMVDEVGKRIKAPCCGSEHFRISWQLPDGSERLWSSPS